MKDKKEIASYSIIFGGILIIVWGLLHALIISVVNSELNSSNVDQGIISLVTLSYLGIVVMISLNGIIVILTALFGIKKGEKWAYYLTFSQGLLFSFVTILLVTLQPKFSILTFSAEFVLLLAIATDLAISVLILVPLIIWKDEFL